MKKLIQKKRLEIRFAGIGGQGLLASATVLGKSLLEKSGKYVCQSQNYGPESRGGLSYADLIISSVEIDFPKIKVPQVLVCMSQESFLRFKPQLQSGQVNMLMIDPEMVDLGNFEIKNPGLKIFKISATLASEEIAGSRIVSNMVLVGALQAILELADNNAIEKVLENEWPNLAAQNIAAFNRGISLAESAN